jgi:hypothetical protein
MSPRPRTVLFASVVLGVVAGLVAALLGVMRPAQERQEYASLPGACTTVSAATLDTYVSGTARAVVGAARAVVGQPTGGRHEQESCSWSGLVGAQTRFLYVRITVYRSATAVTDARGAFAAAPSSDGVWSDGVCPCRGRTQAVPDLGDQAKTTFLSDDVDLPVGATTDTAAYVLVVRSGNAVVNVAYHAASYGPGTAAVPGQRAATTAAARNVLAVLGGRPGFPASVVSGRYGAPGDTCQLIPPAVVARYLPGKVVSWNPDWSGTAPPPSTDTATCRWSQKPGIASVGVSLSLIPFAGGTTQDQEQFQTDVQTAAQPGIPGPGQQSVVEQVAPVAGVADQAAVVFRLDTADGVTTRVLDLIFWAGDAEVVLDLSYQGSAEPPAAVRLAHAVAMARSILGVLARVKPWGPSMGIDI